MKEMYWACKKVSRIASKPTLCKMLLKASKWKEQTKIKMIIKKNSLLFFNSGACYKIFLSYPFHLFHLFHLHEEFLLPFIHLLAAAAAATMCAGVEGWKTFVLLSNNNNWMSHALNEQLKEIKITLCVCVWMKGAVQRYADVFGFLFKWK
jgi:hypothetical protein